MNVFKQQSKKTNFRLNAKLLMLARKLGAYTLLAFLVLPASLQAQTTGIMQITVDTVLTQDHIGIIQVKADGIHLDCDGHSIISEVPSQYAGVAIDTQDGITVTNCHASGFVRGFMAQIAEDIELANNSATNNFGKRGQSPFPDNELTLSDADENRKRALTRMALT